MIFFHDDIGFKVSVYFNLIIATTSIVKTNLNQMLFYIFSFSLIFYSHFCRASLIELKKNPDHLTHLSSVCYICSCVI